MSREELQAEYCAETWIRLERHEAIEVHELQGIRSTGEVDSKTFTPVPLAGFSSLPDAGKYMELYRALPHAVLLLGEHALIAATYSSLVEPRDNKGGVWESVGSLLVSMEHDGFEELSPWMETKSRTKYLGRQLLQDETGYSHRYVSRAHAAVEPTLRGFTITDLGSSNGTRVAVDFRARILNEDDDKSTFEPELVIPTDMEQKYRDD
jgi:hypothetical protein